MASAACMESLVFYCEVCDVRASSEEQLRSHLLGQRHWFNKRQQETAHRSVYVTGFKGPVEKDAVSEVFQQFGTVHKVVLMTENRPRAFAIVEFSDVDSALKALRHSDELVFQGSPLKVKPREVKTKSRPSSQSANDSKSSEEGASTAMEEESRSVSTWRDTLVTARLNISADDMNKLELAQVDDDQILLLASFCQLPHDAIQHRLAIISLLETHLRSAALPNCRVLPFGSFVTGLSTPTSDLDLILLTEVTEDDEKHFGSGYAPSLTTPPLLATPSECDDNSMMDTSSESVLSSKDTSISEFDHVLSVLRNIPGCTKVFGVPNARCPIMRFLHLPTGIHCDLSINNRLALYNTQLIKSYLQCDERVAPLLLVLRVWSRACGLMGHNRTLLNNYSLSLMVIAALQSASPPVLPSLQSPAPWPKNMEWYLIHSEQVTPLMIDGWNVRYCDPGSLKPSVNTSTLSELLQQFFDFYTSFQFSNNAVTIHTPCGHVTSIQEALDSAQSDPRGFKVGCMCVQDPLELSHNVTKSLNQKTFKLLQHELRRAHQITQAERSCVLELLSPPDEAAVSKPVKNTFTLHLSTEHIMRLFYHNEKMRAVSEVVTQLDYSDKETVRKLCVLTCHALIAYWTPLNVVCLPIKTTPPTQQDVTMDTVPTDQSTARKRPREEEEDDTMMSSHELEPLAVEEAKRRKMVSSHTHCVLDEALSSDPSLSSSMSCSFAHQHQEKDDGSTVVRFTMSVTPYRGKSATNKITVMLTGDDPDHARLLANHYAMYKKTINKIINKQTIS